MHGLRGEPIGFVYEVIFMSVMMMMTDMKMTSQEFLQECLMMTTFAGSPRGIPAVVKSHF